jgi:Cu/Ag efflux protein CusF/cytochrome c5
VKAAGAFAALVACLSGALLGPQTARAHAPVTTTVQFDREIVRILDDHCVMCHADGSLSFPLVTYEQAYAARWQIRQDALNHHMAPWAATLGTGDFANDNSLTQREIDFLVSWAESFGPRNNGGVYTAVAAASSAPKVVQARLAFGRWALGQPDLLLALAPNRVMPEEVDAVRRVLIDPKLTTEHWLRGLEYRPGDRRVVRAVSFAIAETGQWIGSWTPWYGFVSLPPALAFRLPAGAHLLAEIHYVSSKEAVVDQGALALYFAGSPSSRAMSNLILEPTAAAPLVGSRKWSGTQKLDHDLNIVAFQPRLGPGLKSVEIAAKLPDGSTQVLLFAQDIPLQWPTPYVFSTPVALVEGTELSVVEHYGSDALGPARGSAVTFIAFAGAALARGRPEARPAAIAARRFKLAGTVQSVYPADGRLIIQHGDIPGLMGAMTMSYEVGRNEDLQKVAAGDEIQSDVVVDDAGTHLENIRVTRQPHKPPRYSK